MQVGSIISYDLQKNLSGFYYQASGTGGRGKYIYVPRVIHNREQIIRCQLRDDSVTPAGIIKYWNMDGTEAAQFTISSGGTSYRNILDIAWSPSESKFIYVTQDASLCEASAYRVYKCGVDGATPELMIYNFNPPTYATWATSSVNGYVGITADTQNCYIKIGANLYRVPLSASGAWADVSALSAVSTRAFHYGDGSNCTNLTYSPTGSGYLMYTWYDATINALYLRNITTSGLEYVPTRWTMLNFPLISGSLTYNTQRYPVFTSGLDSNSLFVVQAISTDQTGYATATGTTTLRTWNVDDTLAAFINVNTSDIVMPAGLGKSSTLTATVVNCWGTTLSGKLVQFWVSSGDGLVNPSYAYTNTSGIAETSFTTGAGVGLSNISVVVNEV
jgi:hypothetical protein